MTRAAAVLESRLRGYVGQHGKVVQNVPDEAGPLLIGVLGLLTFIGALWYACRSRSKDYKYSSHLTPQAPHPFTNPATYPPPLTPPTCPAHLPRPPTPPTCPAPYPFTYRYVVSAADEDEEVEVTAEAAVAQLGRGVFNSRTNLATGCSSGDGRGAAGGSAGGGIMLMPAEESMGAGVYGGPPSGVLRAGGAVPTVASPELRQQFDAIYAKYSC